MFVFIFLSLCITCSPPPLLVKISAHLDIAHTRHPPASSARLCSLRHMHTSDAIFVTVSPPPLPSLDLSRVPVTPWGFRLPHPSVSPVPPPCPPWVLLQILASSGSWFLCWVDFCARVRGQVASNTWHSLSAVLYPPRQLAIMAPFPWQSFRNSWFSQHLEEKVESKNMFWTMKLLCCYIS